MKKILIFGMSSIVGGVENFILNLYENIDKNKFEVDFLVTESLEGFYYDKLVKHHNARVFVIPSIKKQFFKSIKLLKNIIKNNDYDFIHINLCSSQLFLYIWFLKKYANNKVKIITHSHSSGETNTIRKILHYVFRPMLINNTDFFISCSSIAAQWMFGKKIANSDKTIIIKNAILTEKYKYNPLIRSNFRKKYLYNDDNFIIGHVGRFELVKNHDFIIRLFNEYYKINNNARLILVGDGTLKEKIKNDVLNYKLNDVVNFFDVTDHVNEIYQGLDLFILPSLFEGLPIVSIEAQTSGLKCLLSENVTKESNITGNISFLPLDVNIWLNEMSKIYLNRYKRYYDEKKVKAAGYDLKTEIKKIEKIYGGKYE